MSLVGEFRGALGARHGEKREHPVPGRPVVRRRADRFHEGRTVPFAPLSVPTAYDASGSLAWPAPGRCRGAACEVATREQPWSLNATEVPESENSSSRKARSTVLVVNPLCGCFCGVVLRLVTTADTVSPSRRNGSAPILARVPKSVFGKNLRPVPRNLGRGCTSNALPFPASFPRCLAQGLPLS